jgi:hypothetical protein
MDFQSVKAVFTPKATEPSAHGRRRETEAVVGPDGERLPTLLIGCGGFGSSRAWGVAARLGGGRDGGVGGSAVRFGRPGVLGVVRVGEDAGEALAV